MAAARRKPAHRRLAHKPSALTKSLRRLWVKSKAMDLRRHAKDPGWRRSAAGKKYYEARRNRSDVSSKRYKVGKRHYYRL